MNSAHRRANILYQDVAHCAIVAASSLTTCAGLVPLLKRFVPGPIWPRIVRPRRSKKRDAWCCDSRRDVHGPGIASDIHFRASEQRRELLEIGGGSNDRSSVAIRDDS